MGKLIAEVHKRTIYTKGVTEIPLGLILVIMVSQPQRFLSRKLLFWILVVCDTINVTRAQMPACLQTVAERVCRHPTIVLHPRESLFGHSLNQSSVLNETAD